MWSRARVLSLKTPTKKHYIGSAFTQEGHTQSGRREGRKDRARGETAPHPSQWTRTLLAPRDSKTPVTSMLPAQSLDKCDGFKGLRPGGWGTGGLPDGTESLEGGWRQGRRRWGLKRCRKPIASSRSRQLTPPGGPPFTPRLNPKGHSWASQKQDWTHPPEYCRGPLRSSGELPSASWGGYLAGSVHRKGGAGI